MLRSISSQEAKNNSWLGTSQRRQRRRSFPFNGEVVHHWNAARGIFQKYGSKRDLAVLCCNLGDVHLRKAEYHVAQTTLYQALTLAEEIGEVPLAGVILGNLGIAALRQELLSEAVIWLEKGVRHAEQANNVIHRSLLHSYLAHTPLEQGQLKKQKQVYMRL